MVCWALTIATLGLLPLGDSFTIAIHLRGRIFGGLRGLGEGTAALRSSGILLCSVCLVLVGSGLLERGGTRVEEDRGRRNGYRFCHESVLLPCLQNVSPMPITTVKEDDDCLRWQGKRCGCGISLRKSRWDERWRGSGEVQSGQAIHSARI
jgi:hypothetical protein